MKADPEYRYQVLIDRMTRLGLRMTSHRLAIARLLADSDGHPNAASLYSSLCPQFPSISLATVYKTLALLKEEGEILEIALPDDSHFDGNKPYSHPHLICTICHRIFDGDDVTKVQALEEEIREKYDFQVQRHQIVYYGVCRDCRSEDSNATENMERRENRNT